MPHTSIDRLITQAERQRMIRRLSLRCVGFLVPGCLLILLVFWAVETSLNNTANQHLISELELRTSLSEHRYREELDDIVSLVQALSQDPDVISFMRSPMGNRGDFHWAWESMLKRFKYIDQLRLIDMSGHEAFRLDFDISKQKAYQLGKLQDKSHRSYVKQGLSLSQGQVLITEIDLNREFGQLVEPFSATLRVVVQVREQTGQKALGLFVANVMVEHFIRDYVQDFASMALVHPLWLNEEGAYVLGYRPEDAWGWLLASRKGRAFAAEHAGVWQGLTGSRNAHLDEQGHLFYMRRLSPPVGHIQFSPQYLVIDVPPDYFHQEGRGRRLMLDIGMTAALLVWTLWVLYSARTHFYNLYQRKVLRIADALLNSKEGMFITDALGNIVSCNSTFCEMTGFNEEEVLSMNASVLKSGEHDDAFYGAFWLALQSSGHWRGMIKNRIRDGSVREHHLIVHPICDDEGKHTHFVSHLLDMTEQVRLEQEYRLLATAFDAELGISITDSEGNIQRVNRAFSKITGYSADQVVGKNSSVLSSDRQTQSFYHNLWQTLLSNGYWRGELWNKRPHGEEYPVAITITAIYDRNQAIEHFVASFADISERKAMESQLETLATTDSLTGCCNRRKFEAAFTELSAVSSRYASPLSLMMFDIDNFKRVNDEFGHDVGDKVIRRIADTAREQKREADVVGRWGGEEFVLLLPHTQLSEATQLAERLRIAIMESGGEPMVTCSFGVAQFRESEPLASLVKRADDLLYQAKSQGKNKVCSFTDT